MVELPDALIVLQTLPAEFLADLGAYLQTCAHIEVDACQFICTVEGLAIRSAEWSERFHQLRKTSITDLLPELRKAGERLPPPLDQQFSQFVDWINRFKLNRHIAAHGAFYRIGESGDLRVIYTHKRKIAGRIEFVEEETIINRALVSEILADADRILRTLFGLVRAIERGELRLVESPKNLRADAPR